VGDRERLIGAVLAELADETWRLAEDEAEGEGVDGALDTVRRFMDMTASFPPLRGFAEREPQLALRIMLSPRTGRSANDSALAFSERSSGALRAT